MREPVRLYLWTTEGSEAWRQCETLRVPLQPLTAHSHTLLIQDLRLHMAFLLFTASHSRLWPARRESEPRAVRQLTHPPKEAAVHLTGFRSSWDRPTTRYCSTLNPMPPAASVAN